jgi:CubicO group peptidase (beta-lactamase class C family)
MKPILALLLALVPLMEVAAQTQGTDPNDLTGLWKAKRYFGPESRGPLLIERTSAGYSADMMGFSVPVSATSGELTFELPKRAGRFRARLQSDGSIRGFWFTSPLGSLGAATPLTLSPKGPNRWAGQVIPVDDTQTFFLLVTKQPDGSLGAVLRNIERDYGALLGVRGVVRNGNVIHLVGRRGEQTRDTVIISGAYDSTRQVITLNFPFRGGSYDFRRDEDEQSDFYARGREPARYVYRKPPALDDGWMTASVDEVGIERAAIERMVQQVADMSMDSINAPQVHAVLVARRGRLVLEEYFHGEHRDKPHNTRSASKSMTATVIGAAMHAGAPIKLSTPVYQVMNGGAFPRELEPRKRAMTLEHLLTMTAGHFCDDNNDNAPGREDGMWEQTDEHDFYTFALKLPMASSPGEQAIYCSIQPNLALGMLGRAMNESPFYLFDRLVAAPLGIHYYVWPIDRAHNPYGGGGMGFLPRDFAKFGQLMLDSGTWKGRKILSRDFVARAGSTLSKINNQRNYGLLWWPQEYPYQNRTVKGYSALGAGGQIIMVFPELELVIATNGGSYASRGWRYIGGELIQNFILPAVGALR